MVPYLSCTNHLGNLNISAYEPQVHVCMLSHIQLLVTSWTRARQPPLSMGFSRQEYWHGLSFPTPRDLPDPGIEPESPALAGGFFTRATGEALCEPHSRHLNLSHWKQGPGICHFQSSPGCSAARVENLHSTLPVSYFIEKLKQPEDNPRRLPAPHLPHSTYTPFSSWYYDKHPCLKLICSLGTWFQSSHLHKDITPDFVPFLSPVSASFPSLSDHPYSPTNIHSIPCY